MTGIKIVACICFGLLTVDSLLANMGLVVGWVLISLHNRLNALFMCVCPCVVSSGSPRSSNIEDSNSFVFSENSVCR
jgi:hypothetical protein